MEKYFENKRAVAAAVVALGALGATGYFLYSTSSSSRASSGGAEANDSASKKKKKNKKKNHAKKTGETLHGFALTYGSGDTEFPAYPLINDWARVQQLKESERKDLGEALKVAGNKAFETKQFDKSIDLYTQAIKAYEKEPVFYANRAAAYGALKSFDKVVADTSEALKLRPDYVKCYMRRAVGYESLKEYQNAVMDYTSAVILQNFEDDGAGRSVDRVLGLLAEQDAEEQESAESKRSDDDKFPSANFVRAFLQSYHEHELPDSVKSASDENTGEYELRLAFDAVRRENQESYRQAYAHFKRAAELGFASPETEALAYEYLSTFEFLSNDTEKAMKTIDHSLEVFPTAAAMLKRSALFIELSKLTESEADFERARKLDPNSPDLYYQLAQLAFLQQQWSTAVTNYERSIELDDTFILAHIQLAVTEYRMDKADAAKTRFESLIERFPNESRLYNYYGEILLDLKDAQAATKMFDKAIEIEKSRSEAAFNVLPLVNKALALAQSAESASDLDKASELVRQAVALDPQSDIAIGTLAQFLYQQGRSDEAIQLFDRNGQLARNRHEKIQAYTFAEAARTQQRLAKERPVIRERLEMLSRLARR